MNSHSQTNHTKQCKYHQNYGHTIEECIVLKDKTKELVQRACLNDLVRGHNYNRGSYRGEGRGGFKGGYVGGWDNNNQ